MKKIPCLLAAIFLVCGCSSRATVQGYEERLATLRGAHIDQVVMDWGPPDGQFTFEDGRRMYAFVSSRLVSVPVPAPGFMGMRRHYRRFYDDDLGRFDMELREYVCETRFITDKEGRITEWTFRGNACKARAVGPGPPDASHPVRSEGATDI